MPSPDISIKKPLHPTKELLKNSWIFFKDNSDKLISISLIMLGPTILNQLIATFFSGTLNPILSGLALILGILSLISSVWGTIAMITFINGNDPQMSIADAFNQNASFFWSYLWVGILLFLIVLGGLILVIIPGIIWGIMFSLFGYVMICEKIKGFDAANKSRQLIKGYWWSVFIRFLVIVLLYFIIGIILSPLGEKTALYSLATILIGIFLSPFASVYVYNIYRNLQEIKK
ncbi:MAG: hypothetical protein WC310_00885 [Patescibacteria group bacterium]|jgi:hypothetical protein